MILPANPGKNAPECRVVPPEQDDVVGAVYARCVGANCAHFRLMPFMTDGAWVEAVRKAAAEIGDTSTSRAAATKHVKENRAKYGLPTKPDTGYCGLAGKPEVTA